jgi:hypothetical protein
MTLPDRRSGWLSGGDHVEYSPSTGGGEGDPSFTTPARKLQVSKFVVILAGL